MYLLFGTKKKLSFGLQGQLFLFYWENEICVNGTGKNTKNGMRLCSWAKTGCYL